MATIKVTGVDEATVDFVAMRAKVLHFKGQAEYIRNLIREDRARAEMEERRGRLAALVAPLHAHAEAEGYTDEDLADVFERARNEVANARKKPTGKTKK